MTTSGYFIAIALLFADIEVFGICTRWIQRDDEKIVAGRPDRGALVELIPVYVVVFTIIGCAFGTAAILSQFGAFMPAPFFGVLILAGICAVAAARHFPTPGLCLVRMCRR